MWTVGDRVLSLGRPHAASSSCGGGSDTAPLESMVTSKSPGLTASLRPTGMLATTPSVDAETTVSIFMADSTTMGSPAATASPTAILTSTTTPGIGAPTLPTSPGAALGRVTRLDAADVSTRLTERGKPLSSKKTSRVPVASSKSPKPINLTVTLTPWPKDRSISSPKSIGSTKARVGNDDRSPNSPTAAMNSSKTLGYMTALINCWSSISTPCFSSSLTRSASRSTGASSAPGRPTNVSSVLPAPAKI
mmetsp:Transcript_12657/g.37975  ORF Transcript_12657/g.37975 Transcript_12657/m.37975 type:complete len:249 (-) Transcript_12657:473-1219(-)